ncbi:hypothetical protein [Motiliproteus sp. SC1-56]|uniref:SGNH/GDSL hydrolase family protein n=1 Tax=Motiliproteus sp. SC1-56 TaxID=2799565 RepID=UPI001A8DF6CE|nr:hypothetical protein [Motiliproteus sp. SC1-56]
MLVKTRNTLLISLGLMLLIEGGLQVRSHIRYGQSVFNAVSDQKTFVVDQQTGLKLLQPNHRIEGSQAVIVTNKYGLRDESIDDVKPASEYRIALVGASSVMGTYTRNNQDTLSYRLQNVLAELSGDSSYRVINAGIAGYTLGDMGRMVERLLSQLSVDHYVLYPGFNDLSAYCRKDRGKEKAINYSLPKLELPKWLLTPELIIKNTVTLRTPLAKQQSLVDPDQVDTSKYRRYITHLLSVLKETGKPVLVVGNARAFRQDMSPETQHALSETARYYNHCFDTAGLHELFDRHNAIIQHAAQEQGVRYFNLQEKIPGGREYFGDATHFSVKGTQTASRIIAQYLVPDLIAHVPPTKD